MASLAEALRNTRLNPTTLLIALGAAVVLANAAVGASYLDQRSERDALSLQLGSAQGVLTSAGDIERDLRELPARLDEAKQELATVEAAFPSELDSNAILAAILGYANDSGLRVLEAHVKPPAAQPAGSDGDIEAASGYRALGLDVKVEGTFEQLVTFLAAVEDGAASTSRPGAFSLQQSEGRHVLTLEILTYARSTASETSAQETPPDPSSPGTDLPNEGEGAAVE